MNDYPKIPEQLFAYASALAEASRNICSVPVVAVPISVGLNRTLTAIARMSDQRVRIAK